MSTTTNATPNGNKPSPSIAEKSQFLSHLTSYPLISDTLTTITTHPYTRTPLHLTHRTLTSLAPYATPLLSPLTPYLTPYLARLDTLGSSALDALDARVPSAKKPTRELYTQTRDLALRPYELSREGSEHVRRAYDGEVKRNGGGEGEKKMGLVGFGKAVWGTGKVVGGEVVSWARARREEVLVNGEESEKH